MSVFNKQLFDHSRDLEAVQQVAVYSAQQDEKEKVYTNSDLK
jgi:hypothetical protein